MDDTGCRRTQSVDDSRDDLEASVHPEVTNWSEICIKLNLMAAEHPSARMTKYQIAGREGNRLTNAYSVIYNQIHMNMTIMS